MKLMLSSLIVFVMIFFLVGTVSAFEFDNVKGSYDSQKKEVVFKNSFLGIPTSEVARVQLLLMLEYLKDLFVVV